MAAEFHEKNTSPTVQHGRESSILCACVVASGAANSESEHHIICLKSKDDEVNQSKYILKSTIN